MKELKDIKRKALFEMILAFVVLIIGIIFSFLTGFEDDFILLITISCTSMLMIFSNSTNCVYLKKLIDKLIIHTKMEIED